MTGFDATLLKLHDIAMSSDPCAAAAGRLAKTVLQEVEKWMTDEASRSTPPDVVILGAHKVAITLMVAVTAAMAKTGHAADAIEIMSGYHTDALEQIIKSLREAQL